MPFPTPTIRIRLTGLLAFYFTKDTASPPNVLACRIGIHDDNPRKEHRVRVNVFRGPRVKANLILELFRQVEDADIGLTVTDPDPIAPGFTVCPQSSGPFSTPGTNELGFDLIPDIEGPDFNNVILPPTFAKFIRINNGVFYTMVKKPGWILREKGGRATFKDMMGIEAGINIYLKDPATSPASKAVLTYPTGTLTLQKTPGVVFEMEMLNDCPIGFAGPPGIFESDFKLFYDKVSPAPASEDRFSVVFRDGATGDPLSPDHPCGPITGGKST